MNILRIILITLVAVAAIWQLRFGIGDWPTSWLTPGELRTFDQGRLAAMEWLNQNTPVDAVIIAEQFDGNWIVAFARRPVISSSKVYPSEAQEVAQRYRDISRFFFASNDEAAISVVQRYAIDYVYISNRFPMRHCRYSNACRWVQGTSLTQEGAQRTVVGQLLNKAPSSLFELMWNQGGHLIYRVVQNNREPV